MRLCLLHGICDLAYLNEYVATSTETPSTTPSTATTTTSTTTTTAAPRSPRAQRRHQALLQAQGLDSIKKISSSFRFKIGWIFLFESVACLNYNLSQTKIPAPFQAKIEAIFFLLIAAQIERCIQTPRHCNTNMVVTDQTRSAARNDREITGRSMDSLFEILSTTKAPKPTRGEVRSYWPKLSVLGQFMLRVGPIALSAENFGLISCLILGLKL